MSSDQGQGSDPKQPNPGRQNDPSGAGGPQPNRPRRPLMTWVILFSLVALVWVVAVGSNDTTTQVDLNEFKTLVENKDVELGSVSVSAIELIATLKEGTTGYPPRNGEPAQVSVEIAAGGLPFVLEELKGLGIAFEMHKSDSTWMQLLIGFGPILLVFMIIWFFILRSMRNAGGGPGGMLGNFGKSRHRVQTKDTVNVTFEDVAGVQEAKEEVQETRRRSSRTPKRFHASAGASRAASCSSASPAAARRCWPRPSPARRRCPSSRSPARTSSRCSSASARAACATCSSRRKENAPCIIFLDEIDAVGRRRGGGSRAADTTSASRR